MSERYYQLTQEQRYKLEAYLGLGKNQTQIAYLLGVHKSTISRELSRNVPKRGTGAKIYIAVKAQIKTDFRHHNKLKSTKFTLELKTQMKDWVVSKKYSPELVSAQWKKDGVDGVSHECIYNFIWECKHSNRRINIPLKVFTNTLNTGKEGVRGVITKIREVLSLIVFL